MGCTQSSIPGEGIRGRGYSTGMSAVSHSELRYSSSGPLSEEELTERIESSGSNMSFKHKNVRVIGAYVTQRGYYPDDLNKDNQDSYSSLPRFGDGEDQSFFAVYDGHGKDGHLVSRYARDELPKEVLNELSVKVKLRDGSNSLVRGVVQISRGLSESLIAVSNRFSSSGNAGKLDPSRGSSARTGAAAVSALPPGSLTSDGKGVKAVTLTEEEVKDALFQAHLKCNANLRTREGISADLSGTTSISVLLYDNKIYCSNLGDSRAILVSTTEEGKYKVTALSNDQTPYRKDERDRVRKYGARIMSMDQLDGHEPMHDNWQDLTLGEDLDTNGDPPRIWHKTLKVPGTAFTRSIGDFFAESLGVTAEAEISVHPIDKNVRYIIVASDGVFEFLTNKMVADMVEEHDSPIRACQFLVMESYEKWLKEEPRTDDITALVLKIDHATTAEAKPKLKTITSSQVGSMLSMPTQITKLGRPLDADEDSVFPPSPPASIVSSAEPKTQKKTLRSRKSFIIRPSIDEADEVEVEVRVSKKTAADVTAIRAAMSCNFLFQYTSEVQRDAVIDAMQPIDVNAGQVIITQGEEGNATEHFYVVYSGRYEVRQNDQVVHEYVGDPAAKAHPGFGELSLLCDKPRAASVVAIEKGRLLSLNRSVFKQVIIGSMDVLRGVVKKLHVVPEFRCLSLSQLHLLAMKLAQSEKTHASGEQIQTLGAVVDSFAFILSGSARIILSSGDSSNQILSAYKNKTLSKGSCFGVSSLVHAGESHALYSLVTLEAATVQQCSIQDFNNLFGMSLNDLNKAYNDKVAQARSPSASAPASFNQIVLGGCASRSEISCSFIGSFNPAAAVKNAEPTEYVGVHTFVVSEVGKLQRELGVRTHVEACRILAAGSEQTATSAVLPKLLSVYRESNAVHLLYDRALVCDLFKLLHGSKSPNSEDNGQVDLSAGARYVGACVVQALSVIHAAGIVYRNLNMESLMVDSEGRVSLSDYSLCKIGGVGCKTYTVCGDVNYLSPEQTRLHGHNESVDLWALGVLLYEFVVGEFPFAAQNEIATYSKIGAYAADPSRNPLSYSKDDTVHVEVMSIVSQLLVGDPAGRLSGNALRAHPFFASFNWSAPEWSSPFKAISKIELSNILKCGMESSADLLELFVQTQTSELEI